VYEVAIAKVAVKLKLSKMGTASSCDFQPSSKTMQTTFWLLLGMAGS
jgi:hypothetical protein